MIDTQGTVGILNELLASEQRNLVPRLLESTVFISRLSVEALDLVQQMARAGEEHASRLADAIRELGGVVGPRRTGAASDDLHYQELRHLLPRIIADREALVHKYTLAAPRVGAHPRVAETVQHILRRHQEELVRLQQSGGHNAGPAR